MSRIIRLIVCVLILALAPLLLFQGQANASRASGPLLSTNGFNLAELARAGLRVRQSEGTTTLAVEPEALALARQAFVREPLAGNALFVLAIDERAAGGGQDLLDASVELTKRNRYLGALQMEQFSRAGDFNRTFAVIDRLARVYPEMTAEFVQPLVLALRQDDALDIMATALADHPVWANDFWLAVPSDPALVNRMFALRQRTDEGTDATSDAKLMAGLAAANRFDDAIAFRNSLPAGRPQGTGFVPVGGDAPFGWDVEASGERSMARRGDAGYEIFVQQGTSGQLGHQLMELDPGRYTFTANVTPVSLADNVTARLQCANSRVASGDAHPVGEAVTFTVPTGCRAWWLILSGDAWDLRDGLRVTVSDMRFAPAQ